MSRASLVFLFVLGVALLLLGRTENFAVEASREIVLDFVMPVIRTVSSPFDFAGELADQVSSYADLRDKNARLQAQVDELKDWQARAREVEMKLARYQALLNVQPDPSIDYITGQIVADTGGPFVEAVLVDIGRDKGAASGDAVIDGDGIVGRIVGTGERASRVLLLTDLNSRVPVMIGAGEARAVLAGDNTRWPRIEYLSNNALVAAGARVMTSGDGGVIPAGLPVGTLVAMRDGSWRVELFSSEERLDYVRVLKYTFPKKVDRHDPPDSLKNAPPYKTPQPEPSAIGVTGAAISDPAGLKKPAKPQMDVPAPVATTPAPNPVPVPVPVPSALSPAASVPATPVDPMVPDQPVDGGDADPNQRGD